MLFQAQAGAGWPADMIWERHSIQGVLASSEGQSFDELNDMQHFGDVVESRKWGLVGGDTLLTSYPT